MAIYEIFLSGGSVTDCDFPIMTIPYRATLSISDKIEIISGVKEGAFIVFDSDSAIQIAAYNIDTFKNAIAKFSNRIFISSDAHSILNYFIITSNNNVKMMGDVRFAALYPTSEIDSPLLTDISILDAEPRRSFGKTLHHIGLVSQMSDDILPLQGFEKVLNESVIASSAKENMLVAFRPTLDVSLESKLISLSYANYSESCESKLQVYSAVRDIESHWSTGRINHHIFIGSAVEDFYATVGTSNWVLYNLFVDNSVVFTSHLLSSGGNSCGICHSVRSATRIRRKILEMDPNPLLTYEDQILDNIDYITID